MKKKLIIVMICVCILALISSICFGLQNDERAKNSGTIKISAKEDFTYIPNEQRVIYVSEEDVKINKVEPEYPIEPVEVQQPSESNLVQSLDFDAEEAQMLMKIAMAEAGGEGKKCMALVMLTVLNRAWSDKFPNNIYNVIHEVNNDGTYQFTPVSNGAYAAAIPSDECREALNLIMSGWNESQNALYFESCSGSSWHSRNLQFLYQCGKMKFYK